MYKLTKSFHSKSDEEKKKILLSKFTSIELVQLVINLIELSDKKAKATTANEPKKMKISKSEFDKYFEFKVPRKRKKEE